MTPLNWWLAAILALSTLVAGAGIANAVLDRIELRHGWAPTVIVD